MKPERLLFLLIFIILLVTATTKLIGQENEDEPLPPLSLFRAEEDFSGLKNKELNGLLEHLKYIPLGPSRKSFLSLGGEARMQYEYFHNNEFGEVIADHSGWLLQRYMLSANLQLNNLRVYTELRSAFQNFARPEPRVIDEDELALHQMFVEYHLHLGNDRLVKARVGRQEMTFGARRLVSARIGPNVRQTFNAGKLRYQTKAWSLDLFYGNVIRPEPGVFDNNRLSEERLYGAYAVAQPGWLPFGLDLYYIGFDSPFRAYDEGLADEERHSVGLRFWQKKGAFRFNNEFVYQFGNFGTGDIDAYTLSFDLSYQFEGRRESTLGLKTEIVSGDQTNGDGDLQTFNALYPRGAYFGLIALIGPANLIDIHPSYSMRLGEKVELTVDWDFFWRAQTADGVYGPNASLFRSGLGSEQHYLGHQPGFEVVYDHSRYLSFSAEGSWFITSDFFEETGEGENVTHLLIAATFRF